MTPLPKDPQHAQAAFQRLLQSPAGRRLQAELVKAQQDVADAWSLGVEKIPAVVVDRQYVVYGEPDVSRALELIAKARRSR
ncbi:TIGR03757 family integrating conjugative element protein [Pseudomonas aeruginosa]|nr:TIGR03757 family integrating conjugative element protein [Pseudomonas aeruginosa]